MVKSHPRTTKRPKSKSTKEAAVKVTKNRHVQPMAAEAGVKLPGVFKMTAASWLILWRNRRLFSVIIFIYGLVYLVLVLGISSPTNITALKVEFNSVFQGNLAPLYSGIGIFTYLLGNTTASSTPAGSAYQVFIIIVASLAVIWTLRQLYQGSVIRARDSYYRGLYPLAPYLLIILFIALELVPLLIGISLYNLMINGGIAANFIERFISLVIAFGLVSLTLYLLTSSVMALYIVTLPDMTPIKALRSAKELVKNRRWVVLRKIIFLPLCLLIVAAVIMLPLITVVPVVAPWLFYILTLVALAYIHSYFYSLYRGLIDEKG